MNKTSGTKEWAGKNVNIQIGCEHGCRYCYARHNAITRFKICASPRAWLTPVIQTDKVKKGYRRCGRVVMFPSSHDITPLNIEACTEVLIKLLHAGNHVLIVSKPHLECIKKLTEDLAFHGRHRVEFRFSISSVIDQSLAFWEPGAPGWKERLSCLELARRTGYRTSVSIEPMLDPNIRLVLGHVEPWVTEGVWIGRMNRMRQRLMPDGADPEEARFMTAVIEAMDCPAGNEHLRRQVRGFEKIIHWKDSMKGRV